MFRQLERNFVMETDLEFTIEANPDDVTPDFVRFLRDWPVNRVSMGAQSLDDGLLRFLGRRHTARQALDAVELLQASGLANISLDLIYGLPGQTEKQFAQDVVTILRTGIPHLSAYALQIEEGTPLYGRVEEADEELYLACYQSLLDLTADAGFEHYEISNFAREGYRSRHNSAYWRHVPYIGFGPGAHSFDGVSTRRANTTDIREYVNGQEPESERLSPTDLYNEHLMLGLRTLEGVPLKDLRSSTLRAAQSHLTRGTMRTTEEALCLTRQGLMVSNDIISDLFE